jgi:PTS system nitrogen regulatory IIA component
MSIRISDFLSEAQVLIDIRASNKTELLADLCRRAASVLKIDPEGITSDILKREELGSTGMGGGIAIPHARNASVQRIFGMFARLKNPIDFDAIDEKPVDMVFLLLLPVATAGDQLNALALVARKLRDVSTTNELRDATNPIDLYTAMVRDTK